MEDKSVLNTSFLWPLQIIQMETFILDQSQAIINNKSILSNPWVILLVILMSLLIYWIIFPIDIKRDCSDSKLDCRPRGMNLPPVYPNGWIPIACSIDVTKQSYYRINVHIHQVILIRGDDDKVHCYDAFCPHLGADLGVGGELKSINGSMCITCPFHSWSFNVRSGDCVNVPYSADERPPRGVRLKKWQSLERSGFIYVWFHAENEEATWWPPTVTEIENGQWNYCGRSENVVNCHIQEIPENGADLGHFVPVHSVSMLTYSYFGSLAKTFISFFLLGEHQWSATWNPPDEDEPKHIANLSINQVFKMFGCSILSLKLQTQQIGPCLVYLKFTCETLNIQGILVQGVTPLYSNKQKIIHQIFVKRNIIGRLFARLTVLGECNMVDRDCKMWQHKIFLKNPILVKEEKSISKFRHWYSQFYSVNSPRTFTSPLDW